MPMSRNNVLNTHLIHFNPSWMKVPSMAWLVIRDSKINLLLNLNQMYPTTSCGILYCKTGIHLWDSITHLGLWLAKVPEVKMGVRKGITLLLPLTCQWCTALAHRQRGKECKLKVMGLAISMTL